jgi:hypothetical protein
LRFSLLLLYFIFFSIQFWLMREIKNTPSNI